MSDKAVIGSLRFLGISLTLFAACVLTAQAQGPTTASPVSRGWMDKSLSPDRRADLLIEQMTLDEKIQLVHGSGVMGFMRAPADPALLARALGGAGFVPGVARLGIPDLQMADAAVGVALGAGPSRYSTALPSTLADASTWDLKTAYNYGALIGRELRDQGYNMSLGGGVNITRDPRNGRNFEYNGEDPILAGRMDGQLMKGLQAQGVIGDIKHYALNDQETGRNTVNVIIDKRSMRETDLLAFEIAIHDSGAGAVMCSYNRVNGVYSCENSYLLTELLKKDWGFKGWVISDWWATHSTAQAALAGLDQEMPGNVDPNRSFFGAPLKKAVESGEVPVARLNEMVHRILRTEFAIGLFDSKHQTQVVDVFGGLDFAQHVAEEGSVLLKNDNGILPLNASAIHSMAVIGSHADIAVLSGGGSAQVDPPGGNAVPGSRRWDAIVWDPSSPLRAIRAQAPGAKVQYDPGTDPASAAALAKASDVAIVFVNQPSSEGRDASLTPPGNQDAVVSAVAEANPHTIVVLENGGPVLMPWIGKVSAVLESWFPGISGGPAIAAVLFGTVNPSAKLPVTFPKSEADLPRLTIPKAPGVPGQPLPGNPLPPMTYQVNYSEGLKVGYKWYEAEHKTPLFPFGFGLSYTTFSYSGLTVTPGKPVEVSFTVTNTGSRAGAEIAEVYASLPASTGEPLKRLVGWDKVWLASGESKKVTVSIESKFLSIFNVDKDAWELVPGDYTILAGGSSADTPLRSALKIQ
jgi:beta-glucosidase